MEVCNELCGALVISPAPGNGLALKFSYIRFTFIAVSVKLGRLSVGSAKLARSGIDDLLSSTDGGKHDYDW